MANMKCISKANTSFNFYHLPSSMVLDENSDTTIYIYAYIGKWSSFSVQFITFENLQIYLK